MLLYYHNAILFHMESTYLIHSLENLKKFAENFSSLIKKGDFLALQGDLGTGKTTFCRFLSHSLALNFIETIPSPTYTLLQEYATFKGPLWHCDFYRITYPQEFQELGIEDIIYQNICLIEWPEKFMRAFPSYPPHHTITLNFHSTDPKQRLLKIESKNVTDKILL